MAVNGQSRGRARPRNPGIRVVVVCEADGRILLRKSDEAPSLFFLSCPSGVPPASGGDLGELVERQMLARHGLSVSCLGVIVAPSDGGDLVVAATAAALTEGPAAADARWFTIRQLRAGGYGAELLSWLESAWQWAEISRGSAGIARRIRPAFAAALNYLETNMSCEGDLLGWDLYQRGTDIGTLSTALGLMAHIHAGQRGRLVERPVETLRTLQNEDGGWQVRGSLIGASSTVSVTESTAFCLTALRAVGDGTGPHAQRAVAWLERHQRPDGGWPSGGSSVGADEAASRIYPTAQAVRALAGLGGREAVAHGVAWLRGRQGSNGGWRMTPDETEDATEAAYTGHVVITLLACDVPADDPAVRRGCARLLEIFDLEADEPWPSSITPVTRVDGATPAALDFRHFGTPWALSALALAGHGLDEFAVLAGTDRLLGLRQGNGSWRCHVVSPASPPIWTTHDALFALRTIQTTAMDQIADIALRQPLGRERATLGEHALLSLSRQSGAAAANRASRRDRLLTLWMSFLTVAVVVLGLTASGLFDHLRSGSAAGRGAAAVVGVGATTFAALAPGIITEEYKIRRRSRGEGEEDDE